MWLGTLAGSKDTPLGLRWSTEPIRLLGVHISYNHEKMMKANYDKRVQDLKRVLILWKQRDLTLIGRILIVKTLGLSKFYFTSSFLPVPDSVLKEINRLIYNFIWKTKVDKVKRSMLITDYADGGLRMPDLKPELQPIGFCGLKSISKRTKPCGNQY